MNADSIRADSRYAKKIAELRVLDEDELIRQHDELVTGGAPIDQGYYLDELRRRDAANREEESADREQRMVKLNEKMLQLTWTVVGLTVVNVGVVVIALLVAD